MSITSDMDLYYRRTFLGYRQDETTIKPFQIECTQIREDVNSSFPEGIDRHLHVNHDEIKELLCFVGYFVDSEGQINQSPVTINFNDPNLMWDLPDLGYIKIRSKWRWLSYRATHSAKKGINSERISFPRNFGGFSRIVYEVLNRKNTPENPHIHLLLEGGILRYKGARIGVAEGSTIFLKQQAAYLGNFVSENFPEHELEIRG